MSKELERDPDAPSERLRGTAEYIAELSDELAKLARAERLEFLGTLLDMARLEARTVAQRARKKGTVGG
ncbi:hypothetical protein [Enterovirga rhinocerotis]|nr:hypothetical protein [Enterovirga rhinocerotis]